MGINKKDRYDMDDLINIMHILTGENGCQWDKVQTHQSIRINAIEEAYEVVDAIDKNDKEALIEELGDLLLQSVFHCIIAENDGEFTLSDVLTRLCQKLIYRHQHIFGDVVATNAAEALASWESAKAKEKSQASASDAIAAVPKGFPALLRAEKVQKRAAKVGFDFENISQAMDKVDEEIAELKAEIKNNNKEAAKKELGDCLFSLVNVARFLGGESELLLKETTDKFANRFCEVESAVKNSGKGFAEYTLDELEEFYQQGKAKENNGADK